MARAVDSKRTSAGALARSSIDERPLRLPTEWSWGDLRLTGCGKNRGWALRSYFFLGNCRAGQRRDRPCTVVPHPGDRAVRIRLDFPRGVLQLLPLDRTCVSL